MAVITAVSNQKGGVGKTTVTANIGKLLAKKGYKVLLVDNDPQANLTTAIVGDDIPNSIFDFSSDSLGPSHTSTLFDPNVESIAYQHTENLHLIGSSVHLADFTSKDSQEGFEFRDSLESLSSDYDYVFIDCLPSFSTLQHAAHITADYVLIPTDLDEFSVTGVSQIIATLEKTKRRLNNKLNVVGILANKTSAQKVRIEDYFIGLLREVHNGLLFNTTITRSSKISESHAFRQSVDEYLPKSNQAIQYNELVDEFLIRVTENNHE